MHAESPLNEPLMPASEAAIMARDLVSKLESAQSQGITTVITRLGRGDFELDGVHFSFTKQENPQGSDLNFSAQLGYLPFTAESREKRAALNRILLSAQALRRAKFRLNKQGHISLQSTAAMKPHACAAMQ